MANLEHLTTLNFNLTCAYRTARAIFTTDQCIFEPCERIGCYCSRHTFCFQQKRAELFSSSVLTCKQSSINPIENKIVQFVIYFWIKIYYSQVQSEGCYYSKDRRKGGGWDRALLQFSHTDNVMKKWNGWICALSSYNRVQGSKRGHASASAEAAERAQIEPDHKGPNMHWGPRYCQHSCPIQWALKGKSDFKTEFMSDSCYSIGPGRQWSAIMMSNLHYALDFVV